MNLEQFHKHLLSAHMNPDLEMLSLAEDAHKKSHLKYSILNAEREACTGYVNFLFVKE